MSAHRQTDLLSEQRIAELVTGEYQRALAMYARWVHPYAGFAFNRARRSYGQAHRDGRLMLSRTFIDTAAHEDLLDTIRHEFAHLIVGIEQRHNARWKTVAASLGALPRASGKSRDPVLGKKMNEAPFTLVAELRSGEIRVMRQSFRRSRRYMDYRFGLRGQRYHINGDMIERFRYLDNRDNRAVETGDRRGDQHLDTRAVQKESPFDE